MQRADVVFLSTPSARRATNNADVQYTVSDISIHALREEGDSGFKTCQLGPQISIHALREEGDEVCGADRRICEISIHALREEGDREGSEGNYKYYIFLSTPSARRATSRRRFQTTAA